MRRREFIRNAAATAGALLFRAAPAAFTQSTGAGIEVLLNEPLGTISPNIYGHFAENRDLRWNMGWREFKSP